MSGTSPCPVDERTLDEVDEKLLEEDILLFFSYFRARTNPVVPVFLFPGKVTRKQATRPCLPYRADPTPSIPDEDVTQVIGFCANVPDLSSKDEQKQQPIDDFQT